MDYIAKIILILSVWNIKYMKVIAQNSFGELHNFKHCMRQTQKTSRLGECIGRTALNFIQRYDEEDNVALLEDVISTKSDKISARSLVNVLDTDPVDFRGILENAGAVFSQRSLEWHMDNIYPGLMFKIGPTADANSVAEFVLDTAIAERQFGYEDPSTARILTKQYLLPFLLGLKFNLVALVPLLFAGICLLLKKSLFLAKLAIYVSSFLGLGGALGALGSFGGIAGAGFGGFPGAGLAGLGGFGGLGGLAGRPPLGNFPGKTSVYNNHYDELHHNDVPLSPYKRVDRKIKFEQTHEFAAPRTTSATTTSRPSSLDNFYKYEKEVLMQDRSDAKQRALRNTGGQLGPSAYEAQIEEVQDGGFRPSKTVNGWQVVNVRV